MIIIIIMTILFIIRKHEELGVYGCLWVVVRLLGVLDGYWWLWVFVRVCGGWLWVFLDDCGWL